MDLGWLSSYGLRSACIESLMAKIPSGACLCIQCTRDVLALSAKALLRELLPLLPKPISSYSHRLPHTRIQHRVCFRSRYAVRLCFVGDQRLARTRSTLCTRIPSALVTLPLGILHKLSTHVSCPYDKESLESRETRNSSRTCALWANAAVVLVFEKRLKQK